MIVGGRVYIDIYIYIHITHIVSYVFSWFSGGSIQPTNLIQPLAGDPRGSPCRRLWESVLMFLFCFSSSGFRVLLAVESGDIINDFSDLSQWDVSDNEEKLEVFNCLVYLTFHTPGNLSHTEFDSVFLGRCFELCI